MADRYNDVDVDRDRGVMLVEVINRVTHDGRFRAELRRDPVGTAARAGLELSAAEWAGLRDVLSG
ncbi:MAG: Os1348 family NHLP clan protein [Chloroflexota bacterium]|nr:Os1348 family NHLP clan protein [Chloroflexota bacterium]